MADRRTLDSAAKAVQDKLKAAKSDYEAAMAAFDLAQASMVISRERIAILLDAYELVKPKVRVRTKAAKVA